MTIDGSTIALGFLSGAGFFGLIVAVYKVIGIVQSASRVAGEALALLRRIAESGPSDEQTVLAIKVQTEVLGKKLDGLIEKAGENAVEIGHIAAEQQKLQAMIFGGGADGYVAYSEQEASRDAQAAEYARKAGVSFEEAKQRLGGNWLYKNMTLEDEA